MDDVTALEPCPFCGGEHAAGHPVRDGFQVTCPGCGASSGARHHGPSTLPSASSRAIAAWNHRTPPALMPDDVTALIERLETLRAKATPGEWEVDTERNEDGAFGSGPDHGTGYDDFLIGAPGRDGEWMTLFGSENSTAKLIDEDYDEDYHRAWDRTAEANAALIVAAVNAIPVLIAALRERTPRHGWRLVPVDPTRGIVSEVRVRIQEALIASLGDTYDCTRVWSTWGYGTMGEDDFVPVLDRMDEIIDEIATRLAAPDPAHD